MNVCVDRHLAGFNTNLRQTSNSEGNIDRPIPDIEPPMATTSSSFVRASVNFDGFKDVLHCKVSISQLFVQANAVLLSPAVCFCKSTALG